MTHKSTEAYNALLQYIEVNIFKLQPVQFMTDFEAGLRKALNETYVNVLLNGCWFHYTAAVRAKVLRLRLYKFTVENANARQIYRMLLKLPLLPAAQIVNGYRIILQKAHSTNVYKRFIGVFRYFESFWLILVRFSIHPSIHPSFEQFIKLFESNLQNRKNSLSVTNLNMRTISPVEGLHGILNKSIPKRSNFFVLIEGLQLHESQKSDDMYNAVHDVPRDDVFIPRNLKDRHRDAKIKKNTQLLSNGCISVKQFLEIMASQHNDCM